MSIYKRIFYMTTLSALFVFALAACVPIAPDATRPVYNVPVAKAPACDAAVVRVTLLQMNDVYEITPVSGGQQGGLARVGMIRNQLLAENPNTYTVLAGDLFNPSALGTATVDGQRLDGKQMVDVMNVLGLDYATFGNHEFDLKEPAFYQRLSESTATWFSSNVISTTDQPLPGIAPNVIFTATNPAGATVRVGMFGLTLPSNPVPYIKYLDFKETAAQQVAVLKDTEPLDGTEASVRYQPTRLTDLIAQGMLRAVEGAELAIFNGGSIRIDDVVPPGPITEYDVIRILPFGGKVMAVEMTGRLLQQVLDAGEANQGLGGYLQKANVEFDPATSNWSINSAALDAEKTYLVAINDFLISGRERGIEFLNPDNPDLKVNETGSEPDIRQTLIDELKQVYGAAN
jgi:2',3'-cyclic-nucleotide 2'-phosphodiesterase (5'-nucleotidase family)